MYIVCLDFFYYDIPLLQYINFQSQTHFLCVGILEYSLFLFSLSFFSSLPGIRSHVD